jgi:hypothetical protein
LQMRQQRVPVPVEEPEAVSGFACLNTIANSAAGCRQ